LNESRQVIAVIENRLLDLVTEESKLYSLNIELAKFINIKNTEFFKEAPKRTVKRAQ